MSYATSAIKRLSNEYRHLQKPENRVSDYYVAPLEENIFEWHFTLRGPAGDGKTPLPYKDGIYHGALIFSRSYPLEPPDILFFTRSGRFATHEKICSTISSYHKELWQPTYDVALTLTALRHFMAQEDEFGVGAFPKNMVATETKVAWAKETWTYACAACGRSTKEVWETEMQMYPETSAEKEALVPKLPTVPAAAAAAAASSNPEEPGPSSEGVSGGGDEKGEDKRASTPAASDAPSAVVVATTPTTTAAAAAASPSPSPIEAPAAGEEKRESTAAESVTKAASEHVPPPTPFNKDEGEEEKKEKQLNDSVSLTPAQAPPTPSPTDATTAAASTPAPPLDAAAPAAPPTSASSPALPSPPAPSSSQEQPPPPASAPHPPLSNAERGIFTDDFFHFNDAGDFYTGPPDTTTTQTWNDDFLRGDDYPESYFYEEEYDYDYGYGRPGDFHHYGADDDDDLGYDEDGIPRRCFLTSLPLLNDEEARQLEMADTSSGIPDMRFEPVLRAAIRREAREMAAAAAAAAAAAGLPPPPQPPAATAHPQAGVVHPAAAELLPAAEGNASSGAAANAAASANATSTDAAAEPAQPPAPPQPAANAVFGIHTYRVSVPLRYLDRAIIWSFSLIVLILLRRAVWGLLPALWNSY